MRASLHELARRVRADGDTAAAHMIADRMLASDRPPISFTEFVGLVPGLAGNMTTGLFDIYADAYDVACTHARIRGLPETPVIS